MNLWLAATVALLCSLSGVLLGRWFSRLRTPYWTIGYLIPLVLVFAYVLAFRVPGIMFVPPFSWLMGIKKFAIFGFVTTLVLEGTPVDMLAQGLKTEYGK